MIMMARFSNVKIQSTRGVEVEVDEEEEEDDDAQQIGISTDKNN